MTFFRDTYSMKKTSQRKEIDEHLFALIHGTRSACRLIELLPECDVAQELSTLLEIQYNIVTDFARGRHYGSDNIENFIDFSEKVFEQAESLRSSNDAL